MNDEGSLSSRSYLPGLACGDPCAKARTRSPKSFVIVYFLQGTTTFARNALKIKFRSDLAVDMITIRTKHSKNQQDATSGASATSV
jgi:hypothetical protein